MNWKFIVEDCWKAFWEAFIDTPADIWRMIRGK
jgi:hypothetical protein